MQFPVKEGKKPKSGLGSTGYWQLGRQKTGFVWWWRNLLIMDAKEHTFVTTKKKKKKKKKRQQTEKLG
jgi:hypothetical protein